MTEDAEAVAELLTSQALCRSCLQVKTGLTRWQLDDAVRHLGEMIRVAPERCGACRNPSTIVLTLA